MCWKSLMETVGMGEWLDGRVVDHGVMLLLPVLDRFKERRGVGVSVEGVPDLFECSDV